MTALRWIAALVVLIALGKLVIWLGQMAGPREPLAESAFALGFLLLFAFILGQFAPYLHAPKITGYILAGIAAGPFGLDIVSYTAAGNLQLVNGLALSLIAFTAGGELKLDKLKSIIKPLAMIAGWQSVITFAVVFSLLAPLMHFTGFLGGSLTTAIGGAIILGVVAMANSPATVIAVITETGSKGPVSDMIIAVTVIKDGLVVLIFALTMGAVGTITGAGDSGAIHAALDALGEVPLSGLVGVGAGLSMIAYLRLTDSNLGIFVVGAALVIVELCAAVGASLLLASMTAGFLVENYSTRGDRLVRGIEESSTPVYVVFFSLAGCWLDLASLAAMWPFALAYVIARGVGIRQGTIYGAGVSGTSAWTGFIGQAGVSIGFAGMIALQFPQWGPPLASLIMAAIVLNQLAGPIMMKKSLAGLGESERTD